MKLSEYRQKRRKHWREQGVVSTVDQRIDGDIHAAEAAGKKWDPEDVAVLWQGPDAEDCYPTRVLPSGACQIEWPDQGWQAADIPALTELSRRLLLDRDLGGDVAYWHDEAVKAREDAARLTAALAALIHETSDLVREVPGRIHTASVQASRIVDLEQELALLRHHHDRTLRRLAELSGIAKALVQYDPPDPRWANAATAYRRWINDPESGR
jgi:hypothetical protein